MNRLTSEQIRDFVSNPRFDEEMMRNTNTSWPKISIVTPSFNQGQFLERTILSVLNQNYPNLEYVVIDGGSTDNSVEIISKYEQYLTYWVSEKDEGQADAVRKGFRKCTGQVLAFLNSDDAYLPGTLLSVGTVFREKSGTDVVYGNKYLTDEADQIIGERRLTPCIPHISSPGFVYGGFGVYQPASFWTRDLYDTVGEIDPAYQYAMDTELFARFALAHARFRFVRKYFTASRIHQDSKTSVCRHKQRDEGRLVKAKYCRYKSGWVVRPFVTFIRMVRILIHIAQGDAMYLYKRKFASDLAWIA